MPALAGGPPPNDDCANATVLPPGSSPMTNVNATTDGPPGSCVVGWNDVWYDYTADFNGQVTINTVGTFSFDTILVVYEGCGCDPLGPEIDCNDDGIGVNAQIIMPVVDGQCYKIRLASLGLFGFGEGQMNLFLNFNQCGTPYSGSCWQANGSPSCDDLFCCNGVCNADPFCCQVEWDPICVGEASDLCGLSPTCPCDLDFDDLVNVNDLLAILGSWGTPDGDCTGDDDTTVDDLLVLLGDWGPCPNPACDDCADGAVALCDLPGTCSEVVDADGNCACGDLSLPCEQYQACVDGTCPDGFICAVNSCCGKPICVPLCDL